MREVELKAPVDDPVAIRSRIEIAGGTAVFVGQMIDQRFDTADRSLASRDEVLRLRIYHALGVGADRALLDWKGVTCYEDGYKVREERSTLVSEPETTVEILTHLGFLVTREIDREIAQYMLRGATLRFEQYPRMDVLLEVEGPPDAIERAIAATGMPRDAFTSGRLVDFVGRYEARTGTRAAVCARELLGDFRYASSNA